MRGSIGIWSLVLVGMVSGPISPCGATTVYRIRLSTDAMAASSKNLALDLAAGAPTANILRVGAFATTGTRGQGIWQGGPVSGGLVDGVGPIEATIQDASFYNQLVIPFAPLGNATTFDVQLSENVVSGASSPDQVALFVLNPDNSVAFPSTDPLGTNALFAISVTGQGGGDLSVFAPMRFVAPDSLVMDNAVTGVPPTAGQRGRLALRGVWPNPSRTGFALSVDVPEPGGGLRIRVFDMAGRLVAEPFRGKRGAGVWSTSWNAIDRAGHSVSAGVYIVQLEMDGQSLVRRIVLAH